MSSFDSKQDKNAGAEPAAKVEADAKVGEALAKRGQGIAHESGATFHDDASSHAAADAVGARAFTAGTDVYFAAGQHAPGTARGKALIDHELTHVAQSRGVQAPEPGNFSVSSPGDAAEVGARMGSGGGSAAAATIYRDDTPGVTPATTGAGPASGTPAPTGALPAAPAVDVISGGSTPDQQYTEWKGLVTRDDAAGAVTKWATLPAEAKAKFKSEAVDFQTQVILRLHKDSVKVFKDGGVDLIGHSHAYNIMIAPDFAQWLPELRTALFLTPFLKAEPLLAHVDQKAAAQLKLWIDATTTIPEAKAIFQKVYPTLHDTSDATWGTAAAWPLARIQELFGVLAQYLPAGHAATVSGGFVYVTGAGFGWWHPTSKKVWLPDSNSTHGHDMTGGSATGIKTTDAHDAAGNYTAKTGRTVSADFIGADGKAKTGQPAGMGHMTGTILHEVGHGVGNQLDGGAGDKYAENPASFPGFNKVSIGDMATALWVDSASGSGPEPAVTQNAKLDNSHAKDFFKTELESGKGSYSPGWAGNPPRADMATYCKWRYADNPLQKFWDFYVERGHPKDPSYAWDEESARIPSGSPWVYGYLTRGGMGWTKYKKTAWDAKVSWYSLSSPKEWFAEQYTHFYRTEKTGAGLDGATLTLLQRLDKMDFTAHATGGTTITSRGGGAGGATATDGAAAATATTAPMPGALGPAPNGPSDSGPDRPLFFPWG